MTRGRSIVDSKLSGGKIIFASGVPSSLHTSIPLVAPYSIDVKYLTVCGGIWNMLSFEIGELVNLYIKKPVSARNFHN